MSAADLATRRSPRRARDWVLVAVCVVLGGIAGFAYYQLQPPVYTAHTTVLVLPTSGGLDSSIDSRSGQVVIETEAEVANSAEVAAQAADKLDGRIAPEQLREDSDVTVTPNSQVLTVTVQAEDPALARDGAQAISQAYLDQRSASAKALLTATTKTLTDRLDELKAQQTKQSATLNGAESDERASAQAALSLTIAQIADINSRLVALKVQSTNGGQIISAATLPTSPTSPVLWIDLAIGLALGALAGSGLLLLIDRRRLSRASAGATSLGATIAAATAVPSRPAQPVAPAAAPVRAQAARSVAPSTSPPPVKAAAGDSTARTTEARTERRAADPAGALQVLAALNLGETGELGEEDKASLQALCRVVGESTDRPGPLVLVGVDYHVLMAEAAFAVSDAWVAEFGRNVLVFADEDTPALTGRPSVEGRGLSDVLSGEWPALETLKVVDAGRSAVLGPGIDATELPAATRRHRLQSLWEDLEKSYGSSTVEVQVPFESSLAQTIVQTAGPILVVVKSGLSQQQDLAYALEQLTWLGLAHHVVGILSVAGRSRTGAAPSVDLTPAATPEPKAAKKTAAKTAASRGPAAKDAEDDLAQRGAGRAGS